MISSKRTNPDGGIPKIGDAFRLAMPAVCNRALCACQRLHLFHNDARCGYEDADMENF
jgi:hypothetical protein